MKILPVSAAPVYVVQTMRIESRQGGALWCGADDDTVILGPRSMSALFQPLTFSSGEFFHGYDLCDENVSEREYVLQASGDWHKDPQFRSEHVWVRRVEQHEIFNATESLLLLKPTRIVPLTTDFAQQVFEACHGVAYDDAELHLSHAAFELLLDELGREYEQCFSRPWPDQLPEAITDALRPLDIISATRDEIMRLATQIVSEVPGSKD